MSNLTQDRVVKCRGRTTAAIQATTSTTFYGGGLMGRASGRVVKWADTAGYAFLGYLNRGVVGNTSASPIPEAELDISGTILERVAVTGASAATDVGSLVYGTDDNVLTLTPTVSVGAIGRVIRWHSSTLCDVMLFTPEEYAAREAASVISVPIALAQITGAGDVLTNWTPGFAGRIVRFDCAVETVVTTGSKAASLNLEIDTTDVTGGVVALTSANCTPLGKVNAGTAITAANHFGATQTLSIEAASVTAFAEGRVVALITVIRD